MPDFVNVSLVYVRHFQVTLLYDAGYLLLSYVRHYIIYCAHDSVDVIRAPTCCRLIKQKYIYRAHTNLTVECLRWPIRKTFVPWT